jgi:hypothetical protein
VGEGCELIAGWWKAHGFWVDVKVMVWSDGGAAAVNCREAELNL